MLVMMPQEKRKEGELKMKTKEKRKKICGLKPKDNTKKGLCSPSSVTSSLRETYSCVSVTFGVRNGKKGQS